MADITKTEAARRQIESAIDMFFDQSDPLSVFTLAYAAFKILLDIYPHRQGDDFSKQLDDVIGKEGWRSMSSTANFLKHADRDYDAVLTDIDPMRPIGVIGFGTLLYRRITGEFTPKMMAFDYWVEEDGYEDLGIVEIDENAERAAAFKAQREAIRQLPVEARLEVGRRQYQYFLANQARITAEVDAARDAGKSFTEALDDKLKDAGF